MYTVTHSSAPRWQIYWSLVSIGFVLSNRDGAFIKIPIDPTRHTVIYIISNILSITRATYFQSSLICNKLYKIIYKLLQRNLFKQNFQYYCVSPDESTSLQSCWGACIFTITYSLFLGHLHLFNHIVSLRGTWIFTII